MRFDKFIPEERLRPYIKYFIVSESEVDAEYKVFPSGSLVMGFQYKGRLFQLKDNIQYTLSVAGVTGIADSYKVFRNTAGIGSILVYFTAIGFTRFFPQPANELFNLSLSLEDIADKSFIAEITEKLSIAQTDAQRIQIVESFLLSQLTEMPEDKLVEEAVKLIYESQGAIRIKALAEKLFTSQSPLEKRFRKLVGATPKKFASIVRFNMALENLKGASSLTAISYQNNFFDQAHFIKDFKMFTGETPESFKRTL
ncbi:MAG: helix-turn-helix domain-containing protein [Chitinophagaceae bacterium]